MIVEGDAYRALLQHSIVIAVVFDSFVTGLFF